MLCYLGANIRKHHASIPTYIHTYICNLYILKLKKENLKKENLFFTELLGMFQIN